jgi:Photosynthetic reaction centre cytochrome C subunit
MKKIKILSVLVLTVVMITSFGKADPPADLYVYGDSIEKDRMKYLAQINSQLKGKEQMEVGAVFSNLKVLGGFPAENLPHAMNAWSRALGVSCGHCHNTADFSSDEKNKKQIARDMVEMGTMISGKIKTIAGLSQRPVVNCITCHRGEIKPAYKMPVN